MLNGILSTALSGLFAQKRATQAHASNIANVSTTGSLPKDGVVSEKAVYEPYDSVNFSTQDGQVRSEFVKRDPGYVPAYGPDARFADENGLIATPAVSLDEEVIGLQVASQAYKANATVIRTANELSDELLDILT